MQQWLCLNLMHPTGLAGFHTTGGSTGEFLLKPPRDFSVFQKCTQNKSQTTPKLKKRHYFLSHFMMFFIPQNGSKWSKATHVARIHLDFGASDPKFLERFF